MADLKNVQESRLEELEDHLSQTGQNRQKHRSKTISGGGDKIEEEKDSDFEKDSDPVLNALANGIDPDTLTFEEKNRTERLQAAQKGKLARKGKRATSRAYSYCEQSKSSFEGSSALGGGSSSGSGGKSAKNSRKPRCQLGRGMPKKGIAFESHLYFSI